jgi:hypothetical protein
MRRVLLWAGALAFAVWELSAALHWIGPAGSIGAAASQTWARVRADWFLRILVADHAVIAGSVLVWAWLDAGRRGWSVLARLAWTVAFIALGTPAWLGYLAERRPTALPTGRATMTR